ncbi:MAG: acyl carrier protein [Clostridia bacterium]|nr:acyl carrier protein [Lachnospiraceae bacterium]NCB99313.1 acyl carrier protein [Clostridia bacterium]NCD01462.1 acyl carrier protein [Clostridia bacterium]
MELEKLKAIISDVLSIDVNEITRDSSFGEDLGCDSLDLVEIVMGIEEEFDVKIPDEAVENIQTVGDAADEIKKALS